MHSVHDLIITGGTLVDGTGAAARAADVAVDSGRITEVGTVQGGATRTIEADGLLVTPGWVDVHTHYDGQVTWDSELAPSSWHGVTTLVMGNCGVGFAPAQPDRHDWLIGLMEGVEDIPGTALAEGIEWEWETFPEYLDALEQRRWTVDVGTQVPHAAVRAYVMGERGARNEAADRRGHRGHARASCSRPSAPAPSASPPPAPWGTGPSTASWCPGRSPAEDELFGIGSALGEAGAGVFELAPLGSAGEMLEDAWQEVDWMRRLSAAIDRPVSYVLLQADDDPELWRKQLAASLEACAEGARLFPQIAGRPTGILSGHHTTLCLFSDFPAYAALRDRCGSPAELAAALADPEVRRSHRVVDALVAGPGRRHGEGVRAHLHPREPARLRAGARAVAGRSGGGTGHDAAGGGLRRDGPRRRAGAPLHPDPQLRHGRPRPRARDDAAPAGPARAGRRGRPHRDHLRRLHADVHAHALDPRPQPGRACFPSSTS